MTETTTGLLKLSRRVRRAQLPPAAGRRRRGRGRLGDRRRRAAATSTASPAYSALNFGHRHPRLVAAAHAQLDRLTLTSRAFHHDQLGPFCAELADAGRQGHGAADEHRRRGRRDRDQGRPQVGLRGQGRARRPGDDHRRRRATSTAAPPRSSASPPTPTRATTSGRTRPGFRVVPYGDVAALPRPIDDDARWPCCSSRSRARPA